MLSFHQYTKTILLALLMLLLGACKTASPVQAASGQASSARHMVALIDARLAVAPLVAKSKWNSGAAIDDPLREQQILGDIAVRAQWEGLDPALARDFFQSQFNAGKIVQSRLHAEWRQQQLGPFERAPDLASEVRPVLDRLTPELISALKNLQPHLCDADVRDVLDRQASPLNQRWDQATRDQALAPLRCR
ncbi:MAG: gamma subclass chorismate mutase AroQ [Pseudomonadota bacterium]